MAVQIKPLRKFSSGAPSTSDMVEGEIAVNTADKKIFMRDNSNNIVEVANATTAADDIATGDAAVNITTSTGNITLDTADGKIVLDAGITGGFIEFQDSGTKYGTISQDSNNMRIRGGHNSGDVIIQGLAANGSLINSAQFDMSDNGALHLHDNLKMMTDGAILKMGSNNDITLTHVHDTGITITNTVFGDNNPIVLQLKSEENEIESGEVIASIEMAAGDISGTDAATVAAGIHAIAEGNFTAGANPTKLVFTTGVSEIADASATAKMTLSSAGLLTIADDFIIKDAGTIGSTSDPDAIAIGADGDVTLTQDLELQHDGASISFGTNDEIALTHVHDTGLLLTDSTNTPTLQFHDFNEAVSSDGTNLILTSGGTEFKIPTSDGSNNHVLKTDGAGNLSFSAVSGGTSVTISESAPGSPSAGDLWWDSTDDDGNLKIYYVDGNSTAQWVTTNPTMSTPLDSITTGSSASTLATTAGNITIDAQGNDTDIIFKGTDGGVDTTYLTIDGSATGAATFSGKIITPSGIESDSYFYQRTDNNATLYAGANFEILLTHVHNTGFKLTNAGTGTPAVELQFVDSNESIGSDGTNLILTSGGTAFKMPTSDGSNNHVLQTDGAGNLSFAAASGGGVSEAQAIAFAVALG